MFLSKPRDRNSRVGRATKALMAAVFFVPAVILATGSAVRADDCAGQCRAHHNQCRLQTKGSPSCDAELQDCLQRCLAPHKK